MLPELRHAERHHGNALNGRHHGKKIRQRLVEIVAVVPCRAEHDLTVHGNARLRHAPEMPQRIARFFVAEHLVAQQRVGRLHRNVDGHMHFDDAVNVLVGEVRQRDIAALQKGKARVVVLEVDRFAHALGVLVDEAEDTVIAAGSLFVHERGCKSKPGILVFLLADQNRLLLTLSKKAHIQVLFGDCKAIVQYVVNHGIIDRVQAVACPDARFVGRRSGGDFGNFNHNAVPVLSYFRSRKRMRGIAPPKSSKVPHDIFQSSRTRGRVTPSPHPQNEKGRSTPRPSPLLQYACNKTVRITPRRS